MLKVCRKITSLEIASAIINGVIGVTIGLGCSYYFFSYSMFGAIPIDKKVIYQLNQRCDFVIDKMYVYENVVYARCKNRELISMANKEQ